MNGYGKILNLMLALIMAGMPAYAAMEVSIAGLAGQTLADFQRENSGTKPIVAWSKYQDYLMIQKAPKPTLEPSRIRTEAVVAREKSVWDYAEGTKGVAGFLRFEQAKRDAARPARHATTPPVAKEDYALGTKPVVSMLLKL